MQEFLEKQEGKKLKIKRICRGTFFILCSIGLIVCFYFICKLMFKMDNSLSGLISIILTIILALPAPTRTLWRKFVIEFNNK